MIELVKEKIGAYVASRKFLTKSLEPVSFNGFIKNAWEFLIIMPDNDAMFTEAVSALQSIADLRKNVIFLTRDFRVSLVKRKERMSYIEYGLMDFTKLKLPSSRLIEKLMEKNIEVVVDLNLEENLYLTIAASVVKAPYKVCFQRGKSDKYYNFRVINNETDPAISYKNLLNSLSMFLKE